MRTRHYQTDLPVCDYIKDRILFYKKTDRLRPAQKRNKKSALRFLSNEDVTFGVECQRVAVKIPVCLFISEMPHKTS